MITDSPIGCNEPESRVIQLPIDCTQREYDVGRCAETECQGIKTDQTSCVDIDTETYCCQPTQTETVILSCQGYNLQVSKILSCGCGQCLPLTSKIVGRVENSVTGDPLPFIDVLYEGKVRTSTDISGTFSIPITKPVRRVSLVFQESFLKRVSATNFVVAITFGSDVYRIVKMKPRPEPIVLDSTQENSIPLANTGSNPPVAELVIEARTIFDENGDLYSGNVMASVVNYDMRNMADVEVAPSDFTAVDENGEGEELQSFGVFSISLEDPNGNPLVVGGSSTVMVNQDMLPECVLDENGFCDTKMWLLNTKTGLWEVSSELTPSQNKRKKRQTTEVFVGNISITGCNTWPCLYNIDRFVSSQRCWAHVVGFTTSNFSPTEALSDIVVTSILEDTSVDFLGRNNNGATYRSSVGICLPLGCDDTATDISPISDRQFTVHVNVAQNDNFLLPFDPDSLDPSKFKLPSNLVSSLDYKIDMGPSNTAIVFKPTTLHTTNKGPIYLGQSESQCVDAQINDDYSYFQFYAAVVNASVPLLCNTLESTVANPSLTTINTFYAMNPSDSNKVRHCFFGARITLSSPLASEAEIRVVARSELLKIVNTDGTEMVEMVVYGQREILAQRKDDGSFDVCMEYKCGGTVQRFGTDGLVQDLGNIHIKVTTEVSDETGSRLSCMVTPNVNMFAKNCDETDFVSGMAYGTPFCFIDPQTYGLAQKVFRYSLARGDNPPSGQEGECSGDNNSFLSLETGNCADAGNFEPALNIMCSP